MKSLVFAIIVLTLAGSVSAEPLSDAERQRRHELRMMKTGGVLRDVRNQRGRVVIVNCQTAADERWIRNGAKVLADCLRISVDVMRGSFDLLRPELQGEATVFVVDDPKLPISLIAPEARWSVLNLASFKDAKRTYFETRTTKALSRALVPLLGGSDSQYPCCVMGNVLKPEDLDKVPSSQLPVDVIARMEKNMKGLGLGQWSETFYRQACREGWAPAPTNKYQKAVWDQVHSIPDKPMKINFDPATQKGEVTK